MEIGYAAEILEPDGYIRAAAVPDIYAVSADAANMGKPRPGEPAWCRTVSLDQDPLTTGGASGAVHAALKLDASRTQTLGLRIVGFPAAPTR